MAPKVASPGQQWLRFFDLLFSGGVLDSTRVTKFMLRAEASVASQKTGKKITANNNVEYAVAA